MSGGKKISVLTCSVPISLVFIFFYHFYGRVLNRDYHRSIEPDNDKDLFTIPPPKTATTPKTANFTAKIDILKRNREDKRVKRGHYEGLIYAEVPKTGSTTLGKLFKSVAARNRVYYRSNPANRYIKAKDKQLGFVRKYFTHSELPKG